ncbi:hypothetical protein BDV34DRAFT_104070 [Aspergillus parasiticus]|uniref:Uncharacterized protein n=2 Tax=Aspergillus subgen. Circumdati TaxID=2720871 RepID=A0A5N6DJ08_ASPPA|nr:hypothetical protein BDV34DRAFT_104070 [Aspergillus parasiticus]
MLLAGFCSVAINAACHPPEDEIETAALGLVMWEETLVPLDYFEGDVEGVGHCSFTSLDTGKPYLKRLYAWWLCWQHTHYVYYTRHIIQLKDICQHILH